MERKPVVFTDQIDSNIQKAMLLADFFRNFFSPLPNAQSGLWLERLAARERGEHRLQVGLDLRLVQMSKGSFAFVRLSLAGRHDFCSYGRKIPDIIKA
jgi:hypothetical protein